MIENAWGQLQRAETSRSAVTNWMGAWGMSGQGRICENYAGLFVGMKGSIEVGTE